MRQTGTALFVMRVQQLVGLVPEGLLEECLIELLDGFIFMGLPLLLHPGIIAVQRLGAQPADFIVRRYGLAAACNAAARTAHDFDEMIVCLSCANAVHELAGICQAMGNGHAHFPQIAHGDSGFFHAVKSKCSRVKSLS